MARRLPGPALQPLDVVIAAALTVSTQFEIWAPQLVPGMGDVTGSRVLLAVTTAAMTIPLAFRRNLPLAVCCVAFAAQAVQQVATTPTEGLSTLLALLVASYSAGAHRSRRDALMGGLVILVGSLFVSNERSDWLFVAIVLGSAWVGGWIVGHRTRAVVRLSEDVRDLEARQELAAARGAAEERVRIARDLHDVVAHRVSMIVVQAQAADAALDASPERARDSMLAIERTARQALDELRSLLGVLHDESPDARAPMPDIQEIERLVTDTRDAGVAVTMTTEGTNVPVAPSVAMAAYRVVQESLTNVVKHAPGRPAHVILRFDPGALEVTVTNDGASAPVAGRPGHGLAGMRERVRFAGGELRCGRLPSGEFEVRATLPIGDGS